jgi:hypothetical protein
VQLEKYLKLPQNGKVIAEYIWIDGSNGLRSKCKVSILNFLVFLPFLAFLIHAPRNSAMQCSAPLPVRSGCVTRGSGQGVVLLFGRFLIDTLR